MLWGGKTPSVSVGLTRWAIWASHEAVGYRLQDPSGYHILIDNPEHLLRRHRSPTDALLLLRQVVAGSIPVSRPTLH
jgi:hypothetical protein